MYGQYSCLQAAEPRPKLTKKRGSGRAVPGIGKTAEVLILIERRIRKLKNGVLSNLKLEDACAVFFSHEVGR